MDRSVIDNLLTMGFAETSYDGQEGVFYTKTMKASEVPYLASKVVDDDILFGDDPVIYCVCPSAEVQLVYADQYEKASMYSAEGKALLMDIGYPDYDLVLQSSSFEQSNGFDAFGHPVAEPRKQAGYNFCKSLGLESDQAWGTVNAVVLHIEQDEPFLAQKKAYERLDLTGAIRLIAILCTATTDAKAIAGS